MIVQSNVDIEKTQRWIVMILYKHISMYINHSIISLKLQGLEVTSDMMVFHIVECELSIYNGN